MKVKEFEVRMCELSSQKAIKLNYHHLATRLCEAKHNITLKLKKT